MKSHMWTNHQSHALLHPLQKERWLHELKMKIQREGLLEVRTRLRSCQVALGFMIVLDIINTYVMSVEWHMQRQIDVLLTYNCWFC
jgi:hypothetical protein